MDTSEIYIKMCDCSEIQENRPLGIEDRAKSYWHEPGADYHVVWLPRQDQLQGIIMDNDRFIDNPHELLYQFYEEWYVGRDTNEFISMEQLWLAFVMKEKYNKVWTGTEWKQTGN